VGTLWIGGDEFVGCSKAISLIFFNGGVLLVFLIGALTSQRVMKRVL